MPEFSSSSRATSSSHHSTNSHSSNTTDREVHQLACRRLYLDFVQLQARHNMCNRVAQQ
jgi:hypothetical protein